MKRRGIKDTKKSRIILTELGYTYIVNENRNRLFIKVSNSDLSVIKELLNCSFV